MKVPVLSSLILFHARQAGGGYHSLLPSGGGPRTHTGGRDRERQRQRERQREREIEIERERDRQRERQRETERERDTLQRTLDTNGLARRVGSFAHRELFSSKLR